MDADIKNIPLSIDQLDRFLLFPFYFNTLKSAKFSNPMIDMGHIIPNAQLVEFFETYGLFFCIAIFESEFMMTLKKLMVGVACYLVLAVDKSAIERHDMNVKQLFGCQFISDSKKAVCLRLRTAKNMIANSI